MDVDKADVSLTTLNAADVGPVEITGVGKCLLRKSLLLPDRSNALSKRRFGPSLLSNFHAGHANILMTISPRTLSIQTASTKPSEKGTVWAGGDARHTARGCDGPLFRGWVRRVGNPLTVRARVAGLVHADYVVLRGASLRHPFIATAMFEEKAAGPGASWLRGVA